MSQQKKMQDKVWSKPELTRLGKLTGCRTRPAGHWSRFEQSFMTMT